MQLYLDIVSLLKVIQNAKTASDLVHEIGNIARKCTQISDTLNLVLEEEQANKEMQTHE